MNCMYIPPNASDTISYFEETVISGLACQLAAGFTSPALLSDTGGDVRGCLSGSHGVNARFMMSPASEEEEDGVLLLLLCMIFVSLISPVCPQTRINTRIRSQWAATQTASLYSLLLTFMFISVSGIGPSVKALITSSVILQKHQLIRGALPSIGDNCHPRREMQ